MRYCHLKLQVITLFSIILSVEGSWKTSTWCRKPVCYDELNLKDIDIDGCGTKQKSCLRVIHCIEIFLKI